MTSKRRAALRREANGLDTIFQIGKSGIDAPMLEGIEGALAARELIKLRVLESCELTAREASDEVCSALGADGVQTIGSRFVIYRRNPDIDAYPGED